MNRRATLTPEQLLLIYNNTSDLVFVIAVTGAQRYRVESVNRAYLERTQLESADIVGRYIDEVLHGDDLERVRTLYDEAVAQGGAWSYRTCTRLHGSVIYLDTTLVPVRDPEASCSHLIGFSREVTQSRLEHQALLREKQRAENYLDIAEAIIVALDRDANITLLNRKGYAKLGYPDGSLTGRDWCELVINPDKAEAFHASYRRIMETGTVGPNVNYVRTSTGERILVSWANAVIRDEDGRVAGVLSSGEDITDRRRAEQAMIASQRVLAASEVVSAVAHDFNNSLQGILGNIEIALASADRPQALRKHLEAACKLADDAARRLEGLRATGGRTSDDRSEPLDLHELIEDVIDQTQPLWKDEAQRRGHDIRLERRFSADLPPIAGDARELRSALYNIVKNSVEAIDGDGSVRFETAFEDGVNVVTVTDSGCGMDTATCTRIFQPFFSTKGMEAGRGLGMSATHSIVQAHHGEVRVAWTVPGRGTAIEVRLPGVPASPAAARAAAGGRHAARHRILWVDDDPEVASLARSYIAALHHEGDVAANGAEALALLARGHYSVVITDVGMPGMNGLELARQIHRTFGSSLPVVALTGWGDAVLENGEAPEGIRLVLAKPIRLAVLRDLLDELPAARGGS